MGKRGPKPKGKVHIEWSSNFAYAIGLLVTDGSLSKNGRHIAMASKDTEQLRHFMSALGFKAKIGSVISGSNGGITYRVQIGDILFYSFLCSIGLMPNKSKIMESIAVPPQYFSDFLRGHFDGDGSVYTYRDARWKNSLVVCTSFVSASEKHILWLQREIERHIAVRGHISKTVQRTVFQLRYGKRESRILWKVLYADVAALSLSRKRLKIMRIMRIIGKH